MPRLLRTNGFRVALLALVLALGFLGSRGIWDPDEGRYTNVALNMLDSGDWLNPRRNHEVGHWTKPPLTYWAIAASVAIFGSNPWAARLPAALAYLLCVWFAWRIARRIAPGAEDSAAVIYATMLFTVGAGQMITTDYVLAACVGLAMWAFIEARFPPRDAAAVVSIASLAIAPDGIGHGGVERDVAAPAAAEHDPRRWLALMWVGFALAFVAKGPAALLPLPAILAFDRLLPGRRHRALQLSGIAVFLLLAMPWYVAVMLGNPGLFEYFVGDEVINRVTTNDFNRHGQWYGWLQVYVPTLLLGTLPWTPALLRWTRTLPASLRRWRRDPASRVADAGWLLLTLWLGLSLLVFCLARSRLPLYLLPLFVPLAVVAAMQRQREGKALPRWRWLVAWAVVLVALRVATAYWPTHKNAAGWAEAIRARAVEPVREVLFVEDMARYGLHLHLGTNIQIERIALEASKQPRFNPSYDEPLAVELAEGEPGAVWICKQARWPEVRRRIEAMGYRATPLGTPYRQRVLFRVQPVAAVH